MGSAELRRRHRLFVQVYLLSVATAVGVGCAFALGGAARFSGPSFTGLRTISDMVTRGAVQPHLMWGAGFMVFGVALIATYMRPAALHLLRFGFFLYLFLVLGFAKSLYDSQIAAASGVVIYAAFALLHLALSEHLSTKGWVE